MYAGGGGGGGKKKTQAHLFAASFILLLSSSSPAAEDPLKGKEKEKKGLLISRLRTKGRPFFFPHTERVRYVVI